MAVGGWLQRWWLEGGPPLAVVFVVVVDGVVVVVVAWAVRFRAGLVRTAVSGCKCGWWYSP